MEELSDATPVYPSFSPVRGKVLRKSTFECPRCSGATSIRVCQVCHSILPANFTVDSPLFGLVGRTRLGQDGDADRAQSGADHDGRPALQCGHRHRRQLEPARPSSASSGPRWRRGTISSRRRPTPTGGTRRSQRCSSGSWPARASGARAPQSTILSFYDTSGEDLASVDSAREQHYLAAADGLILLLDPFGFPANRDKALGRGVNPENLKDEPRSVLRNVTELLRTANHLPPNKKIKRPLAIVLAKIDAFFDAGRRRPSHPEALGDRPSLLRAGVGGPAQPRRGAGQRVGRRRRAQHAGAQLQRHTASSWPPRWAPSRTTGPVRSAAAA